MLIPLHSDFVYKRQIHIGTFQAKKDLRGHPVNTFILLLTKLIQKMKLVQNQLAGLQQIMDEKPVSYLQILCLVVYKDSAGGKGCFDYSCFLFEGVYIV